MQYINEHIAPDALVLFIFVGTRGYYCDREYRVWGENVLHPLIVNSNTPEEILAGLKAKGITHLLIYHDLFEKWVKINFSEEKSRILEQFFRNKVMPLYYKNGFSVFALRNLLS